MCAILLSVISCGKSVRENGVELLSPSSGKHADWVVEAHSPLTTTVVTDGSVEVVTPKGLTLWYDELLTGDYQISYKVKFIMEGGEYDRLSDLNCFWGASDPENPKDIFERSIWRNGEFGKYNTLDLFYVGYGGNHNTTTRFREYRAEFLSEGMDAVKPVIKEYTDEANRLKPNVWMNIVIKVKGTQTSYSMNGEEIFSLEIPQGRGDGYFGIRLLESHTIISDFSIKAL